MLSFVIYFASMPDSLISMCLSHIIPYYEKPYSQDTQYSSPIEEFVERKFLSNMGFVLEALLEAFPQVFINVYLCNKNL